MAFFAWAASKVALSGDWLVSGWIAILAMILIAPMTVEVLMPGRYMLPRTPDEIKGKIRRLVWRCRQMYVEYPGWDGKVFICGYLLMLLILAAHFATSLLHLVGVK